MKTLRKGFRRGLVPMAVLTSFAAPAAQAQESWLDDTYVAPMASYSIADDDRHSDDAWGGTLAAGWRLSERAEVELVGTYLKYKQDNDYVARCGLLNLVVCTKDGGKDVTGGGFGFNYFLFNLDRPFGGLFLHTDVITDGDYAYYRPGLGIDLPLGNSGFTIRGEALWQARSDFEYKEPVFNLGFRIPLGKHREPVVHEISEPVQVVQPLPPPPPPPPPPPCTMSGEGGGVDFSGCKTGDTVVLRGVNFEFDKSSLTVNAKQLLDQVVDALNKRPDIKVEVDGHTDSKGSDAYNMALSQRRAKSVQSYLISKGIAADRLSSKGYGETMPIADNATDEGRELNRRVELKVTEAGAGAVKVEQEGRPTQTYDAPAAAPAPFAATAAPEPAPAAAAEPATAGGGTTVTIADMAFGPGTLTVPVGTTVTFLNNDGSNHIVRFADGQQSPRLAMGKSWTRSFSAPGEYPYVCTIHPQMTGKIIVQ